MTTFSEKFLKKKKFGQHFLTEQRIVDCAIDNVRIDKDTSIMEIGGGAGFLTQSILQTSLKRMWLYEIDPDWSKYLQYKFKDYISESVLSVFEQDFLQADLDKLKEHGSWVVLGNLPYNITFPILERFKENRDMISEGVIMVQEEVAQKIVKKGGRGYGVVSLFFQRYFDWKLLSKVGPGSFDPPPKVNSRLLHFVPKKDIQVIENEDAFWKFVKACFVSPRRTLRNNLMQSHYDTTKIDEDILKLRAQQLKIEDFLKLWEIFK